MRLYLSSLDLGDATSDLVRLAPHGRVALILNALDGEPDSRAVRQARETEQLEALDFRVGELDLRRYFGDAALRTRSPGST